MLSDQVDLNLLKVFLKVYSLNSITLAAEALNSTQPAISGMLKRLTNQLDLELFVRNGRGISPTSSAIQLATELTPFLMGIDTTLNNLKVFDENQDRTFNIYVTESIMLLLQPLVEADKSMGGCSINFQLSPLVQGELLEKLSQQKVDLAIDFEKFQNLSYRTKLFYQDDIILNCRNNHPIVNGNLSLSQFYSLPQARLKLRRFGFEGIQMLSKITLEERNIKVDCDSILQGLAVASQSALLCLSPKKMSQIYSPLLHLQELKLPFETHKIDHYMIWHKRTDKNVAHQWLREKLLFLISQVPS